MKSPCVHHYTSDFDLLRLCNEECHDIASSQNKYSLFEKSNFLLQVTPTPGERATHTYWPNATTGMPGQATMAHSIRPAPLPSLSSPSSSKKSSTFSMTITFISAPMRLAPSAGKWSRVSLPRFRLIVSIRSSRESNPEVMKLMQRFGLDRMELVTDYYLRKWVF